MKTTRENLLKILTLAVLLAAVSRSAQAKARAYVRPVAQYVVLADQNISDSGHVGGGIAAGVLLGQRERFEIGAEISHVRFDGYFQGEKYSTSLPWVNGKAAFEVTPLLVTFRYYFRGKDVLVRPYVGPVLGCTQSKVSLLGESNTAYGLSAGLNFGVSVRLGQRLSLDAGYRYINSTDAIDGWLLDFSGNRFRYKAHVLNLALNVRL